MMTPMEEIVLLLTGLTQGDRYVRDCPICQSGRYCGYHLTIGGESLEARAAEGKR